MGAVRTALVSALVDQLPPDILVKPYAVQLDGVSSLLVMVDQGDVVPSVAKGAAPGVSRQRQYDFTLLCIVPTQDPGVADDDLDDLLEDVLFAIEQARGITWSRAERATVDDTWPAYLVAVSVRTQHTRERNA